MTKKPKWLNKKRQTTNLDLQLTLKMACRANTKRTKQKGQTGLAVTNLNLKHETDRSGLEFRGLKTQTQNY